MEYSWHVKAKKKAGEKDSFVWFSAGNDSAAVNKYNYLMDESGLNPDHYFKPVRTDFPVVDDLPPEGVFDTTWCDRYCLDPENGVTWQRKPGYVPPAANKMGVNSPVAASTTQQTSPSPTLSTAVHLAVTDNRLNFEKLNSDVRVLAVMRHGYKVIDKCLTEQEISELLSIAMDTDNPAFRYEQDFLHAVRLPVFSHVSTPRFASVIAAVCRQCPKDGKDSTLRGIRDFTQHLLSRPAASRNEEGFKVVVALLVMGVDPMHAKAADVRNAKELVQSRETAWLAWYTDLSKIPGITLFEELELFEVTFDGMKNLKLIHDAEARAEYIRTHFMGHPMLPDYTQESVSHAKNEKKITAEEITPDDVDTGTSAPEMLATESGQPAPHAAIPESPLSPTSTADHGNNEAAPDLSNPAEVISASDKADNQQTTDLANVFSSSPLAQLVEPVNSEVTEDPPVVWPTHFEPGRYADLPNEVYHGANGISSTMLKDARVSLLWYHCRHVAKTIVKEESKALSSGSLVHVLALQPEKLEAEFNIEPVLPEGALTTAATLKAAIESYNAALPAGPTTEDLQARIATWNDAQRQPFPLGNDVAETGTLYAMLPPDFQTIPPDQKHTAAAMKAAIKQYNATLPPLLKTSGSREELLTTLEAIEPQFVLEERKRPQPEKVSGSKDDLAATIKRIRPDAVIADEIIAAWRNCEDGRTLVTQEQMRNAKALQKALFAHPSAGPLLKHANRENEVSYFGIDEDTGLEIRVRPDAEITVDDLRIGMDLKTISLWGTKQSEVRARLHREIINRDYHLSAAMYSDVAQFDQFFWIFINTDPDYNWIAIVEASPELLELGRLEYRKALRDIDNAYATNCWPAPVTEDYTDELTDYDLRRLEALRKAEGELQ